MRRALPWAGAFVAGVVVGAAVTDAAAGCRGGGAEPTTATSPTAAASRRVRPPTWARPLERSGLRNLHEVSEDLYRGAQPTAEGMRELERLGVKTVVNLRMRHSDAELLEGTELVEVSIPAEPWDMDDDEVVRFLEVVTDPDRTPVFVHCHHGSDRTGAFAAAYRVVVQGWDREEALREMTEGGFGFHPIWTELPAWVRRMDAAALRRAVGATPRPPPRPTR